MLGFFIYKADDLNKKGTEYEKMDINLGMLLVAMMPLLPDRCDDDVKSYSIGDFSWIGRPYGPLVAVLIILEGDRSGLI